MSHHDLRQIKEVITRVLHDSHGALAASDFLRRVVDQGYEQDNVVAAVREMLETGDIRFNADMRVCLTRELA